MAAPVANDRKLGANVRRLALLEVQKILLGDDEVAKKEMVFKLAPNLMPRLTEISGTDGEPLKIVFDPVFNAVARTTTESDKHESTVQDS